MAAGDYTQDQDSLEQDELMRQLQEQQQQPPQESQPKNTGIAGGLGAMVPEMVNAAQGMVPGADKAKSDPFSIPDSVYSTAAPSGWDPAKWADKNKHDAKYDMRRVLNDLDPKQGWTPDALARVNSLGYGQFTSDGGDGLNLSGITDAGRKAGLSGDYQGADFINGFKGDHPTWGYSDPVAEAAEAKAAGPARKMIGQMGAGAGPSSFQGIQSMVPTDTNTFNRLQQTLAQILGGPKALEQEELMKQLGVQ